MNCGKVEPTAGDGRGHSVVSRSGVLRDISGNISRFKSFVYHLHSKMHHCTQSRDSFPHSWMPTLAAVCPRAVMEDTRRGCVSHKCELPILHGECGVISLNDSVNSPEDTSGHDC